MIKSYIQTAIRNILNNKIFSLINIVGLAIGLSSFILITQYVNYELSFDTFHENAEDIYRVQYNSYHDGELRFECAASVAVVASAMKENFPEVLDYVKFMDFNGVVKYDNITFREEKMQFATPSFFNMFTFPLVDGDPEKFKEPFTCALSQSAVKKYFGAEDPLDKVIQVNNEDCRVVAVFEDVPHNSHIKFSILVSFKTLADRTENQAETSWGWYDFNNYVQLKPGTDHKAFDKKFDEWLREDRKDDWRENSRQEFILQPITDIHLYSDILEEAEPDENGDASSVYLLMIVAIAILLMAWINYNNLTISKSMERAKEIGVRKVNGATRIRIIKQFIIESLLINTISLILALIIIAISMSTFNDFSGIPIDLDIFSQWKFILFIFGIYVVGGIVSAFYPAFVFSSYNPVSILKGKYTKTNKGVIQRRILVMIQFSVSVFLIAGTLVVFKQMDFLFKQDLGFDMNKTLVTWSPRIHQSDTTFSQRLTSFRQEIVKLNDVKNFTVASNIPGYMLLWSSNVRRAEADVSTSRIMYFIGMDDQYVPSYNIKVLAGRNFDKDRPDEKAVIVNSTLIEDLGFESNEDAINKKITIYQEDWTIIGVIDSYNQMSLKTDVTPLVYFHREDSPMNFFSFKLVSSDIQKSIREINQVWEDFFPGQPVDYFFLDEFYNKQYLDDNQFKSVFSIFAIIAIIIACLGLFGLSLYEIVQRVKEIGIRKVHGCPDANIVALLFRKFLTPVILSNIIAIPLVIYVMNIWLSKFAYQTELKWWFFLLGGLTTIIIAVSTIMYNTVKAAKRNPVENLRYE